MKHGSNETMRQYARTIVRLSLVVLPGLLLAQGPLDPTLLLKPPTDAWPSYHGDYTGRHYSPLKQVTVENAKSLSLAWLHRTSTNTHPTTITGGPSPPPAARAAARADGAVGDPHSPRPGATAVHRRMLD